jgi:hypothetical protein
MSVRSNNLDLIRWMEHGHESTCKRLSHLFNAYQVSTMATGRQTISDSAARAIEDTFNLPMGWLDRDNIELLKMDAVDYEVIRAIRPKSGKAKNGLVSLLIE